MPLPNIQINITANIVAAYAALMSTCTGAVQLFNFLRDRSRVRVKVGHKMQIMGDPRYRDKTLTIVTVINAGRRPVTISTVGATCLHPTPNFIIVECQPSLPYELTEGKNLIAILPNDAKGPDLSRVASWEAWDAVGKAYRLHVAPWHRRFLSLRGLRREWRQKSKKTEPSVRSPQ